MPDPYSILVTDWFRTNYGEYDWTTDANLPEVGVVLFTRAPDFSRGGYKDLFKEFETLSDITNSPEWVPITSTLTTVGASTGVNVGKLYLKDISTITDVKQLQIGYKTNVGGFVPASVEDATSYGWKFDADSQDVVATAVFYTKGTKTVSGIDYLNPIMFATTQGIGELTVAHTDAVFGQMKTGVSAPNKQYIVSIDYTVPTDVKLTPAFVLLYLSQPKWEPTRTQHLWIAPQRVNLIADPSFETTSLPMWRVGSETDLSHSPTISRVTGGLPSTVRDYCGHVSCSTVVGTTALESNYFPISGSYVSVSFFVRGTGLLRFGIVYHNSSYDFMNYEYSEESDITLPSGNTDLTSGFIKKTALFNIPDNVVEGQFRLEFQGDEFWIDNVIVDPHEGQFDYFDGNSIDSISGDFRWVGSEENANFSVWYNNYINSRNRLMGGYDDIDEVYKPGFIEEWIPVGANVSDHWDVISSTTPNNWVGDMYYPIHSVSGTAINDLDAWDPS
jgi:hypothetical protein